MNRPDNQNILPESTYILVLCHFIERGSSQNDADDENCGKKTHGEKWCRIRLPDPCMHFDYEEDAQSVVLSLLGQ